MARRSREINIFHFSFLDILFNTIGAITFMFMIFAVMTNDLVEEKNVARIELNELIDRIEESREEKKKITEESEKLQKELEKIEEEIQQERRQLRRAKTDIRKQKIKLKQKDKAISQLKKQVASMERGTGIDTELDPALMAEWGEAGGSEATKIQGQVIGANIESVIVSAKGGQFTLGGTRVSSPSQVGQWIRYYDENNRKIQFLSDSRGGGAVQQFEDAFERYRSRQGTGLKSDVDIKYYGTFGADHTFRADADRDGRNESTYFDLDRNGKADKKLVDLDGDGVTDEAFFHFDPENRRWKTKLADTTGDGRLDTAFMETDTANDRYEIRIEDFDPQTGKGRAKYEDRDKDGVYDTKWVDVDKSDEDWEEVYTQFNREEKRWTVASMDTNNDSVPDVLCKDTDLSNESYEEKQVDADYDGIFDSRWMDLEPDDADWEAEYVGQDESTGFWKEVFFDSSGDGKWDVHGINTNIETENFEILLKDEDSDGTYEVRLEDNDSDGSFESRLEDRDKDGEYETALSLDPATGEYVEEQG